MNKPCPFVTRTERKKASLSVPACCYQCHIDHGVCTKITKENSVVLYCSCQIAICRSCAKVLLALHDETFNSGLNCPQCQKMTKDLFHPEEDSEESCVDWCNSTIDFHIDKCYDYFKASSIMKEDRVLSILFSWVKEDSAFSSIEATSSMMSVAEFSDVSYHRQRLIIARLEAQRTISADPLDQLKFLNHSSLLHAISLATDRSEGVESVHTECLVCMSNILDGDCPLVPINCKNDCRYNLCLACSQNMMRSYSRSAFYKKTAPYKYMACPVCAERISPFENHEEAQELENVLLKQYLGKLFPTYRKSERTAEDNTSRLKGMYQLLHSLGIVERFSPGTNDDFEKYSAMVNVRMELVALAAYYEVNKDKYSIRSTRSKVGVQSVVESHETQPLLQYPTALALKPKSDIYKYQILQFASDYYAAGCEMSEQIVLPQKPFFQIIGEGGESVYDQDPGASPLYRWFKLEDYLVYFPLLLDNEDGDLDDGELIGRCLSGLGGRVVGRLVSPLTGVPSVTEEVVQLSFRNWFVLFDPPPDKLLNLENHQKGICVIPDGNDDFLKCRIVLGKPSENINDITSALINVRRCYEKICKKAVQLSCIESGCYSFRGNISLFSESGKPWLSVLSKTDIIECLIDEKILLRVLCRLISESAIFNQCSEFWYFCQRVLQEEDVTIPTEADERIVDETCNENESGILRKSRAVTSVNDEYQRPSQKMDIDSIDDTSILDALGVGKIGREFDLTHDDTPKFFSSNDCWMDSSSAKSSRAVLEFDESFLQDMLVLKRKTEKQWCKIVTFLLGGRYVKDDPEV